MVASDDPPLAAWIERARRALGEQDLAGAERFVSEALRRAPADAQLLALRGLVEFARGDGEGASSWLRRAIEAEPACISARLALGRVRRAQGDLDGACRELGAVLASAPAHPAARFELARIASLRGEIALAIGHYEQAARHPALAGAAHFNRASLLHRSDRLVEAVDAYELALAAEPPEPAALRGLARALHRLGRFDEARSRYAELLATDGRSAEAQHLLAALAGEPVCGCPAAYVAELFDDHADHIEPLLLDGLEYATHRALADLVWEQRRGSAFDRVIDLGCGTGLFGVEMRPHARWLGGVDLSARMLAKAADKRVYDALEQGELPGWLEPHPAQFDLLAAADVLPYFGALDRLFAALRRSARPAALVALSVEATAAHPYELGRSGRFAHHPDYLTALARLHGLEPRRDGRCALRREGGEPVAGFLVLLEAV